MAKVRLPDLPPRLYRYCSLEQPDDLEHEIDAIDLRYVHATTYRGMNDPMEGFYEPSGRLKQEPQWRETYRNILLAKRSIGIACFSETFDNAVMWAHYADNFRGICIAYSASKLRDLLPDSARLVRVSYADTPIYVSKHDKDDLVTAAQKILSQKRYNWAYEREWRVLGDQPGRLFCDGDTVTDIYFGSRILPEKQNKLLSALSGRSFKFRQMKVTGYNLSWGRLRVSKPVRIERPTGPLN